MGYIVARSILWGGVFGAIAAVSTVTYLSIYWEAATPWRPGELIFTAMFVWVPLTAIMGGGAGAVLFGVVALIMSFRPQRISALSYAALGSLLSLGLIIPFAGWLADGYLRALQGAQGTYLLLPYVLLPVAIAGFLTGLKVQPVS
jgi:hypothetical protein